MTQSRRNSRELALQLLYAVEISGTDELNESADLIIEQNEFDPSVREYGKRLVLAALDQLEIIDALIQKYAMNWEMRRMAAIDRNLLRLAVGELRTFKDVPYKVVIDEAVEIAKIYGSEDSGKFINGILDSIRKELIDTTTSDTPAERQAIDG